MLPQKWFLLPLATAPCSDGDFLPDDPAQRDGEFHHVNLMAGSTRDDGAIVTQRLVFLLVSYTYTESKKKIRLKK